MSKNINHNEIEKNRTGTITFAEYILEKNRKNEEYVVLLDDFRVSSIYIGNNKRTLSAYAYEKYGEILHAECKVIYTDKYGYDYVVVYSDNIEMKKNFTYAFAGYCTPKECDMLFPTVVGRIYYADGDEILELTDKEIFEKELEFALYNGFTLKKVDDYTKERVWNKIYHKYFDDKNVVGRIYYVGSQLIAEFFDKESFCKQLEEDLSNDVLIQKVEDYTEEQIWENNFIKRLIDSVAYDYYGMSDEDFEEEVERLQAAQNDDYSNDYDPFEPYYDHHWTDSKEILHYCFSIGEHEHSFKKNISVTDGLFLLPKQFPVHNDNETAFSAIESVKIRGKGNMSVNEMYEYFESKKGFGDLNYNDIYEIENVTLNMIDWKGAPHKTTVDREQFFLAIANFHELYREFYAAYQRHEANITNNYNRRIFI